MHGRRGNLERKRDWGNRFERRNEGDKGKEKLKLGDEVIPDPLQSPLLLGAVALTKDPTDWQTACLIDASGESGVTGLHLYPEAVASGVSSFPIWKMGIVKS